MELPENGSLMAISIAMIAVCFLPPYLLNLFLFMLPRGFFMPHEYYHSFPTLGKGKVR